MRPSLTRLVVWGLLVAATFVAYWPVRDHEFIGYDDAGYVRDNPHVQAGFTRASLRWAFTTGAMANWHPVTWLSHMLDSALFGLDPGWHHLTNVWLHAANAVLLFLVLEAMTGAAAPSAVVAALFALHPLHVESVAWVAERKDVLSALFWMLTIAAYLRYVRAPARARYALVVLTFGLGLMAKPMLVTLPFVLLLLDFWPLGRFAAAHPARRSADGEGVPGSGVESRRVGRSEGVPARLVSVEPQGTPSRLLRLVLEKAPLFVLAAASSVITFVVQRESGAVRSTTEVPLADRLANAIVASVAYLGKTFWPVDLACFYPYRRPFVIWQVVSALLILGAVSLVVCRRASRRPYLLVGWLWFLGTLVPVIGIVQVGPQAMADRYTYLPLIGVFIMVVWSAGERAAHWRLPGALPMLAAGVVLLASFVLTRIQVGYWRDGIVLFEHALAVTRDNHIAHFNLGAELARRGRTDDAIAHYHEALRITPQFVEAHEYLASALTEQGRFAEATAERLQALRLRPGDAHAVNGLGAALWKEGRIDEAMARFAEALELDPASAEAHNNLGLALRGRGRDAEAIAHYDEALRLAPDYADAHYNLANALAATGRLDEARAHYGAVFRLAPDHAEAHNNLGVALAGAGRLDEAAKEYGEAIRIRPSYVDPYVNLAAVLRRQGRLDEAIARYGEALGLDPVQPDANYGLANVLAQQGKNDQAIARYGEALQARPNFPLAHNNLGLVLAAEGRTAEAIAHYSEALRLDPDFAQAYYNRGVARRAAGESAAAEADLARARALDPRAPR